MYDVHSSLMKIIESLSDDDPVRADLKSRMDEKKDDHFDYLGHQLSTKHQWGYYKYVQKNLKPGECVVAIDYEMKLELGKRSREIQRDWYGRRGLSLHGCYVAAQVRESEKSSEVLDLWCGDTKQNAFLPKVHWMFASLGWRGHFQDSLYTSFQVCERQISLYIKHKYSCKLG